jgi:hypothetical protein
LEDEYYFIELEISAIEADANFQMGNLFIDGKLRNQYREIVLNRMAALSPKNYLERVIKDLLRFFPFTHLVFDLDPF